MTWSLQIIDSVNDKKDLLDIEEHWAYTGISRKVVGKSARDNPERYCG